MLLSEICAQSNVSLLYGLRRSDVAVLLKYESR